MHNGVWLQRCLPSLTGGGERSGGRGKGVREGNAEELVMTMGGFGRGKAVQLPDNLAGHDTLSYVEMKQRRTEMWGAVTRWRNSSFSSSHPSGKKRENTGKPRCFQPAHANMCGHPRVVRTSVSTTVGQSQRTQIPRLRGHQAVNIISAIWLPFAVTVA